MQRISYDGQGPLLIYGPESRGESFLTIIFRSIVWVLARRHSWCLLMTGNLPHAHLLAPKRLCCKASRNLVNRTHWKPIVTWNTTGLKLMFLYPTAANYSTDLMSSNTHNSKYVFMFHILFYFGRRQQRHILYQVPGITFHDLPQAFQHTSGLGVTYLTAEWGIYLYCFVYWI